MATMTAAPPTLKKTLKKAVGNESKPPNSILSRFYMILALIIIGGVSLTGLTALISHSLAVGPDIVSTLGINPAALSTFSYSSLFLFLTLLPISIVARLMATDPPVPPAYPKITMGKHVEGELDFNKILEQEFEYASDTAAQAMEHRMTIVNFFLIVVGGAGSVIGGILAANSNAIGPHNNPLFVATIALLWMVFMIGWLSLFKLLRLRQAWYESVTAMGYIKEFYIYNSKVDSPELLYQAFFFNPRKPPAPFKPWNVFHFSAILVALLDSGALFGGYLLLGLFLRATGPFVIAGLVLAAVAFFAHTWVYDIVLKPKPGWQQRAALRTQEAARVVKIQPASAMGGNMSPRNTVVSTKQIFTGKLINVRVDDIRLPDGQPGVREIVEHKPAVVIVAYLEDSDEFLFVEQYRDALGQYLLEVPAGMIDPNEQPIQTARRELREETGYEAGEMAQLGEYYTSPGFTDERHTLFVATKLTKLSGIQDTNEISAIRLVRRDDAMSMIEQGALKDGKSILGILWGMRYLSKKV